MVSWSTDATDADARVRSGATIRARVRSFLGRRADKHQKKPRSSDSRSISTQVRMNTSTAATKVQASWRGNMVRRSTDAKTTRYKSTRNLLNLPGAGKAPFREDALRAKMAAFFWGSATPEEQLRQLSRLEAEFAKIAPTPVATAEGLESAKALAEPPVAPGASAPGASAAEIASITKLQAGIRGRNARIRRKSVAVKLPPPRTSGISLAATLQGVACTIAAFLVWQFAVTMPRFFDWLVQVAGFAALVFATLYCLLQRALPDQADEEVRAATLIQALTRGKNERRQGLKIGKGRSSKNLAAAVPLQVAVSSARAIPGSTAIGAAIGAVGLAWLVATVTPRVFSWVAYPTIATALVCGSVYGWLRLPFWLGYLASELITRLAMHGYPLRMRTLRVRPWVELRPLTLHLDLSVTRAPMPCRIATALGPRPGCSRNEHTLPSTCAPASLRRLSPGQPTRLRCAALCLCGRGARRRFGLAGLPQEEWPGCRLLWAGARAIQHARGAWRAPQLCDV